MHRPSISLCRSTVALAVALSLTVGLAPARAADAPVELPAGVTLERVDFERHVMGLFGRMGCNAGSCHGSFQGKGGFRLSLFGYQPEMDYFAVTRDLQGRRVNQADPDQSLLLLKATGQVSHGGGVRFGKDGWQYRLLRQWIASGAAWDRGSGTVERVEITPPEHAFGKAGESVRLRVTARFTDGSASEITPLCDFRTNDDAVAQVTDLGEVKALRPGSTDVIVTYRGNVVPVRVLVPNELPKDFVYPKTPENNYVDGIVFERLRKMNVVPSQLCSDEEFLRRLTIDTIGQLPTPEEVRAFLKDTDPDKRAKKIDRLLEHPLHAAVWATRFCDITGNDTLSLDNPVNLRSKRSQMWHDWLRKRFHENAPYDDIVRGMLVATSRDGRTAEEWARGEYDLLRKADDSYDFGDYAERKSLDLFWQRRQKVPIEQWGERTAAAFMGVRLECAQCHKHPFDRWSQEEYRAYANVFAQVGYGVAPDAKKAVNDLNQKLKAGVKKGNQVAQLKETFVSDRPAGLLKHPDTNQVLAPRALGGPEIEVGKGGDPRAALFEWLRRPDNPFFAPSFVNRVWGHYFGIGIVDPVDDFSLANPPSNPKLLEALAKDFVDSGFDVRHIERVVLNSRAYQLSSETNETNRHDKNNYSHAYLRPMMAEVVLDVMNSALDVKENFGKDVRPDVFAVEVGPSTIQSQQIEYAFRIFGRPPRTAACDCERAMDPALPQKLYTMTDNALLQKLQRGGRLGNLLQSNKSDDEVLEALFLATLTRFPTDQEKQDFRQYRNRVTDRRAAFQDVLWALVNTREFILNH